ncbi:hypothetical protein BaRGS_00003817 [Batillaria attramentaria]|uniref:Glycosyltransferase family 92 protein n=1 Tax=Batillaria attramentaria TaxID=370345 RepID=A0ABD0M0G1_9CAEN
MSAVYRHDYPLPGAFNLVLVSWADSDSYQHKTFVCCLTKSRGAGQPVQAPARRLFMNRHPWLSMRLALYGCSVADSTADAFQFVTFAEASCDANTTLAREIAFPANGSNRFAACVRPVYGDLDPVQLVEWMEMARIVGVDVVQVFYHILSKRTLDVFLYYESTGFVILSPTTPAVKKGYPPRGFSRPRWTPRQDFEAWMDGWVTLNDCVHRLSRYDFVAILDFDELLVPSSPYNTVLEVAQAAAHRYPQAAAFFIHTYVVPIDGPPTNNRSLISFLRHLEHSVSNKLDDYGWGASSPKIVVRPTRVTSLTTRTVLPAKNYISKNLPDSSYKFLHYRRCQLGKSKLWRGCDIDRVRDSDILRFEPQWLQALSQLPLARLGFTHKHAAGITRAADAARVSNRP